MHNADSPRYRYNSLDGKLQRHKSGQEIDSSFKFFHLGCLGFQDKICDGFRLCRGFDSFPQTDGYAELDKSQSEVHQEIVIVNLNEDKNLVRFLLEVVDSIQNIFDVLQKVKILAEMTADRLGGPAVVGQVAELYWSQDVKQKESLKIQLGDLNIGQHIHRAIMFKFLADNLSVPVRLQWGEEGDQAYLWEGENEYEVDLMQNPGNITKVEYFSQKSGSDCNVHRESECKSKSLPIDMNLPNLDKVSESNHSDRHSKPKSSRTVGPFKFLNKFGINQVKSNRVQSCPMFDITRAESDKDSDFVVVDKEDIPIPRNSYSSNNENEGQIIREWIQQQSCSDCAGPITVSNIAEKTRSLQKQQHDASFKYVLRQEDNNSDTFQVCENCSQNQTTEFEFDIKTTAIEQDKSLTTQPVTSPRCCSPFSIHGPRLDPSPHLQDQSTTVSPEDSEAQFEPTDPFSSPEASPELAFEKNKEGCIDWGGAHTETNDAVNREVQQSVVEGNDIDMHAKQDIVFDLSLADIRPRGNSEEIPATPGSVLSGKSSLECGPTHAQVTELSKWLVQYEELENLQPLDKGSYGQVYLGTWNHTPVAVKTMFPANFDNCSYVGDSIVTPEEEEESTLEFIREVQIMMSVSHRNIVQFYCATLHPEKSIVTEFVKHGSLYNLLHRPGRDQRIRDTIKQSLGLRLKFAIDVAIGVNYLHYKGIWHLDLKTQNLLLGDSFTVKVCDFGLSRIKVLRTCQSKGTYGTPEYMAPEVLRDCEKSEKADIFSFGVILYELVTLRRPWQGESAASVWAQVAMQNKRIQIPENVDRRIAQLIERCWMEDPQLRPDFGEIIKILEVVKKDYPVVQNSSRSQSPAPEQLADAQSRK